MCVEKYGIVPAKLSRIYSDLIEYLRGIDTKSDITNHITKC